jgi:hypothetical protein
MRRLQSCVICVSCFASSWAFAQEPTSGPTSAPASAPSTESVAPASTPTALLQPETTRSEDGKLQLSFDGFVAAQVVFDSNDAVGQNHLVSVAGDGDGGRLGFAFDASRFNLVAKRADEVLIEGRAEIDLQSAIFFRIRHVYASITKDKLSLLVGQTDTLIGNIVGPGIFNNDWFFAQGNAYDRTQQIRLTYNTGKAAVSIAAVPNLYGAVSATPHFQGRVSLKAGPATLGVGAHFGFTPDVANPADPAQLVDVTSYLVAADAGITAGKAYLSLQGWIGAGGAHGTGGHAIGNPLFVVGLDGRAASVPSVGGFLDVFYNASKKLYVGAAGGASIVTNATPNGVDVPIENNFTGTAYLGYSATDHWKLGVDAQFAQTLVALDSATPDVRTNVQDVRLLFGQKFSF